MKSLELTERQKARLLEMCNTLFPEYKEIVLTKHHTLRFGYSKTNVEKWIGNMSIHWFEFCFTELADKIFNKKNINRHSYYIELYNSVNHCIQESENNHPVDYLYLEFLKAQL